MSDRLLLVGAGELCTCDPARGAAPGIINDAALVADGETITWVGPRSELPAGLARAATSTLDVHGACVIPGFVDSHTHLVFGGDRSGEFAARADGLGYAEIAAAGGGIGSTIAATSAASDATLLSAALERARAATRSGTTTIEVKTGYGADAGAELRLLRVIGQLRQQAATTIIPTLLALHRRPTEAAAEALAQAESAMLPAAVGTADFVDVFCDPVAWSVEECRTLLARAAALGFRLKLHAEQTARLGGAELAAEVGAVSADHLEQASVSDAAALAAAGVVGVLLPGVSLSLGTRVPDAAMLAGAGVQLALATDCNPGTSYSTDMRLMVALGVGLLGLSPAAALVAATSGGAAALALADRGVLAAGRRCDLAILEAATHVDLAYRLGDVSVREVVVGGRRHGAR